MAETLENGKIILGKKGFSEWVYNNFMDDKKDQAGVPLRDRKPKLKVPLSKI